MTQIQQPSPFLNGDPHQSIARFYCDQGSISILGIYSPFVGMTGMRVHLRLQWQFTLWGEGCPHSTWHRAWHAGGAQQHLINGKAGGGRTAWLLQGRRAQGQAGPGGCRDRSGLPGGSGTELSPRGGEGWEWRKAVRGGSGGQRRWRRKVMKMV